MLHHVITGTGRRVVLVHGFTQTMRSWEGVVQHLEPRFEVVRVELPGHGGSAAVRTGFVETAAAIGACGGPAVYVGYSMGGRLCLRLALDRPDMVQGLVLVSASPGLADATARAQRRRSDEQVAAGIESGGVDAFLRGWLSQPMFDGFSPSPAELNARRANPPDGLAHALRALGAATQEPLWHRLESLRMPLLLLAGEADAKFVSIAEQMGEEVGGPFRLDVVPGSGHAVPLEQPRRCAELIAHFVETGLDEDSGSRPADAMKRSPTS